MSFCGAHGRVAPTHAGECPICVWLERKSACAEAGRPLYRLMSPILKIYRLPSRSTGYDTPPLPTYKSAGASGLDLHADLPYGSIGIQPGSTRTIGTGMCVEIPVGFEGQVRPRSSLSAGGTLVTLGTIDADYRGEIAVILTNSSSHMWLIDHGQRIAQLVIAPVARVKVVEVTKLSDLSPTERGAKGFGSTGSL